MLDALLHFEAIPGFFLAMIDDRWPSRLLRRDTMD
jgi:hypothetical protein